MRKTTIASMILSATVLGFAVTANATELVGASHGTASIGVVQPVASPAVQSDLCSRRDAGHSAAPQPLASPSVQPAATAISKVVPAVRPAQLTAAQYAALQTIQASPEHRKILDTSATYSAREESLRWTRFSDDFWTVAYDVGWPGAYLGILLCAL